MLIEKLSIMLELYKNLLWPLIRQILIVIEMIQVNVPKLTFVEILKDKEKVIVCLKQRKGLGPHPYL
tara:strand:- start:1232 stop:1432 length:201 start_codon:yes stop_codon:yes gene_type:complete